MKYLLLLLFIIPTYCLCQDFKYVPAPELVIIQVSDTAKKNWITTDYHSMIQYKSGFIDYKKDTTYYIDNSVIWIKGYKQFNPYTETYDYLDINCNPLPDTLIIWMIYKNIKNEKNPTTLVNSKF